MNSIKPSSSQGFITKREQSLGSFERGSVNTIDNSFKEPVEDLLKDVLHDFDIDHKKLENIPQTSGRRESLLKSLVLKIKSDIQEIESKEKRKLASQHTFRESTSREKNKKDIFQWLKLPTKYENLKRMLRGKLVQLLTDVVSN